MIEVFVKFLRHTFQSFKNIQLEFCNIFLLLEPQQFYQNFPHKIVDVPLLHLLQHHLFPSELYHGLHHPEESLEDPGQPGAQGVEEGLESPGGPGQGGHQVLQLRLQVRQGLGRLAGPAGVLDVLVGVSDPVPGPQVTTDDSLPLFV